VKSRHHDSSDSRRFRRLPPCRAKKKHDLSEISCVVKNKKHQNSAVMLQFSGTNLHACFPGVQAVCTQVAHSCRVKAYVAYFTTPITVVSTKMHAYIRMCALKLHTVWRFSVNIASRRHAMPDSKSFFPRWCVLRLYLKFNRFVW